MSKVNYEALDAAMAESFERLQVELKKQAREPFKRALQKVLGFPPTAERLQEFANKSPDRWAQAVSILAGLAGYEKGINVTVRTKPVDQLTDQELLEEVQKGLVAVAALARGKAGEVVDAEVLPSLPVPTSDKDTPHG